MQQRCHIEEERICETGFIESTHGQHYPTNSLLFKGTDTYDEGIQAMEFDGNCGS
jgi:hypothetical protein